MKASLTVIAAALIAALGVNSASAATVTFQGEITDVTCSVTGGSGTNGALGDFIVNLPSVSAGDLTAIDDTAGDRSFTIQVGGAPGTPGDCGSMNGKTAAMYWNTTSANIDALHNVLTNTVGTGFATGVGVELLGQDGGVLDLTNTTNNNIGAEIVDGSAELTYTARYKAISATIVPGDVSTSLEYVIGYN